jgi:hypothetical protein
MGGCRIRVLIAKELLPKQESLHHDGANRTVSIVRMYTADTPVREVAEGTDLLWGLFSSNADFELWDCTYHPPKNITAWPVEAYPDLMGPKCKTLHDAGCFPSGTWLALPKGVHPDQFSTKDYDDVQYNNNQKLTETQAAIPSNNKEAAPPVTFKDSALASSKPLPSQVMESVTKRFEEEDEEDAAEQKKAKIVRQQNKERKRKLQQERATKLDQRIQKLEEQSSEKNKKVSDQVRRMLVKSRATGNNNLKMQDRIYFQCLLDDGNEVIKEYRYVSPQDTFAKIASSFPNSSGLTNSEVLVRQKSIEEDSPLEYRRFPVAMRVYEAMSNKFLTDQVDTMIIRWYEDGDDATPSVLEKEIDDSSVVVEDVEMKDAADATQNPAVEIEAEALHHEDTSMTEDVSLTESIKAMDDANSKGKKPKKNSAAAMKVRNMQIKSKAKGDAKRIPKVENRFFLEVVMIRNTGTATSSFQFLAKTDPIERLLQKVASKTPPSEWDFLVPTSESNKYETISNTSMALAEAEENGILKSFERIILRSK